MAFKKWIIILFISLSVISCSRSEQAHPGYIEGEYTYISSGVSGILFDLYVKRGQKITKDELLYRLDPEPEHANVAIAKAHIASLEAQISFAKSQLQRQSSLYPTSATTKSDLDRARSDFDSKTQDLSGAQAELVQREWSAKQKIVATPIGGTVFDTFYRVGETVPLQKPVLAILAPENIKVLFYIPENQLSAIKLGEEITFGCDGCKENPCATISYISPEAEYTPPVIYSKDTRYKLVYLVRADIPLEMATQFHPGQPIDVYLPL